jgi:hypothetical protein
MRMDLPGPKRWMLETRAGEGEVGGGDGGFELETRTDSAAAAMVGAMEGGLMEGGLTKCARAPRAMI